MKTIELPWPPTANHLTMTVGRRRVKTKKHREYVAKVRACVFEQKIKSFGSERLRISIHAFPPDKRKRDIDNLFKAVLDGLSYACVFDDDSQIDRLSIERHAVEKGGRLLVSIERERFE